MLGGEIRRMRCFAMCVQMAAVLTSIWCPTFRAYLGEAKSATACIMLSTDENNIGRF